MVAFEMCLSKPVRRATTNNGDGKKKIPKKEITLEELEISGRVLSVLLLELSDEDDEDLSQAPPVDDLPEKDRKNGEKTMSDLTRIGTETSTAEPEREGSILNSIWNWFCKVFEAIKNEFKAFIEGLKLYFSEKAWEEQQSFMQCLRFAQNKITLEIERKKRYEKENNANDAKEKTK